MWQCNHLFQKLEVVDKLKAFFVQLKYKQQGLRMKLEATLTATSKAWKKAKEEVNMP